MVDKNKKTAKAGQTLLELTAVLAISSILAVATFALLKSIMTTQSRALTDQTKLGSEVVGNRQLWFDTRAARISFNRLSAGSCGNNTQPGFFDYLPDAPCTNPKACSRCVMLGTPIAGASSPCANNPNSFLLATTTDYLTAPTPLSPAQFFDFANGTPTANDLVTSPPVPLVMNTNTLISTLEAQSLIPTSTPASGYNSLLLFFSPMALRPPPAGGATVTQTMSVPPRAPSLFVRVTGKGAPSLQAGISAWTTVDTNQSANPPYECHPLMPWLNYASPPQGTPIEAFFRTLPPVGGQNALVLAMQAMVVQYYLSQGTLYRQVYQPGTDTWAQPSIVASGVQYVLFSRSNITVPSIQVSLQMVPAS